MGCIDEVMAGLNPTEIDDIVKVIKGIRDRGVTIFLIEHVMKAVMNLSDRTYVLNDGKLIASGTPSSVAENPQVIEAYPDMVLPSLMATMRSAILFISDIRWEMYKIATPCSFSFCNSLKSLLHFQKERKFIQDKVENLAAGYGLVEVLRDISLEIKEGEVVAVLGSNGVGKTTLNNCMSGLIKPNDGKIFFEDEVISNKSPEEIVDMGLIHVPEGRKLFPNLTVRDNLELGILSTWKE